MRFMSLSPLRIRLLGGFELRRGRERVALDSGRVQSLLAFLLLHRELPQPRQRIAFLFWPDSSESQARTNFRNLLHHLRSNLPEADGYLDIGTSAISWRPDAPVDADVVAFEEAVERAERETGPAAVAALEEAIRAYGGDLLPGCYDEWLLPEQERLRQRYAGVLRRLVALHEEAGDLERVITAAQRLLRHDPLDEDVYRRLIRAHTAREDRAQAVRAYHACASVLEHELGIAPSPPTHAAYEAALGLGEAPPTAPASAEGRALVGRSGEWTRLRDAWRAATTARARLALVSGEAGIGKTRLVEELARSLAREGFPVAQARSYATEGALAYGPVIEWLRSDALRPRLAHLDPPTRTELSRLLPELAAEVPDLRAPESLPDAERRQRIYDALMRTLSAPGRPVTLIADDLQWCDRETLEFVHYLVRRSAGPLLIVGTARTEELDAGHPLRDVMTGLARLECVTEIELDRLDLAQTAALAEQLGTRAPSPEEADRLYRETEGNPLFIIETLRTAWTGSDTTDRPTPDEARFSPKLQAVIESRLRLLSLGAREIAELAATIGREFTVEVLARASERDEGALLRALDELWRRRIVREQGTTAYDFSHDKIREVTYHHVTPPRRREYHLRVARALEDLHGDDAAAVSGRLGFHFDRAGLPARAIEWYGRAAGVAQQVGAHEKAIGALSKALALLEDLPDSAERNERELALQLSLGSCLGTARGWAAPEVGRIYARARVLCERAGDTEKLIRALWGLYSVHIVRGTALRTARELGEELVRLALEQEDASLSVAAHFALGCTLCQLGEFSAAREHLEQATSLYDRQGQRSRVPVFGSDLGVFSLSLASHALWHLGYPDQALERSQRAIALAEELSHRFTQAIALAYAAMLHQFRRDRESADERAQEAVAVSAEHGFPYYRAWGTIIRGWALAERGEVEEGIARMRQGMAGMRATGAELRRSYYLALLAEARGRAGHTDEGLALLEEALTVSEGSGERWKDAELYRLKGELLMAQGGSEREAEAAFRQALDVARLQAARALELRAAVGLSRLLGRQGAKEEARRTLAEAHGWFTEGDQLPDHREAAQLLNELA